MTSKVVILLGLLTFIFLQATSAAPILTEHQKHIFQGSLEPARIVHPDDPIAFINHPVQAPRRDLLGEVMEIGNTFYDYQHNGSVGKMIARDEEGGTHFTWMCGFDAQLVRRHMCYNFLDENDDLMMNPDDPMIVDAGNRSGYCSLDVFSTGQAAVFGHLTGFDRNNPDRLGCGLFVDWLRGLGAFTGYYPPNPEDVEYAWPKGAIDQNDCAHIVATASVADDQLWQQVGYWRGTSNRDFDQWDFGQAPVEVDITGVITSVATASPQSEKVALAWHHNRVGPQLEEWDNSRGAWQRNNDIRFIISEDGENWNWDEDVESMTKIIPPNPDLVEDNFEAAYGDTFRPYCDIDIAFDPWEDSDNLYGVFAATGFFEEPVPDDDPEPVDLVYAVFGHLWFWNAEEDTITMIYDGWYNNYMENPNAPEGRNFRNGVWRTNADRGSIAFDPDNPGHVYVVWVWRRPIMDQIVNDEGELEWVFFENAQDTSESGFINAEIMVSGSTDYGLTWREPINITETIWDGDEAPGPGECQSEDWVSVAPLADDGALHIMYILDLDAGGVAQQEGVITENPVLYHRVELEDLDIENQDLVELPREGFIFHNYPPVEEPEMRELEVPLVEGWNLISINVTPPEELWEREEGPDIVLMLEPIVDFIRIFKDERGHFYAPAWRFNNIPYWDLTRGFWIKTEEELVATWAGVPIPPDTDIPLAEGWNAIAYFPDYRLSARAPQFHVLSPIIDHVIMAKNGLGQFLTTAFEFSNMENWREGQGYQVKMENGDVLNYPEARNVMALLPESEGFGDYAASSENMSLLINSFSGLEVQVGDQVIARNDLDGIVGGGTVDQQGRCGLAIWGDDPGTPETEGLQPGESFRLQVQQTATGQSCDLQLNLLAGPGCVYETNGFTVVAGWVSQTIPEQFYLAQCYPNPFNNQTRISFGVPQSADLSIKVFDLSGRLVETLAHGSYTAGHHSLIWNAQQVAAGTYLIELAAPGFGAVQKVLLMK